MANWYPFILATGLALLAVGAARRVPIRRPQRPFCIKDDHPCLTSSGFAECRGDGKCACKSGYHGEPKIGCVKKDFYRCIIDSDPQGTPYSGGPSVGIPLPCRYLASHIKVSVPQPHNFWCSARVYVYGTRFHGKMFLSGFDVRLDWDSDEPRVSDYTLGIKAYGKERPDGSFEWDLLTRHSKFQGGEVWQRDDISLDVMDQQLGGTNVFQIDETNNRVEFISTRCGLRVAFRLYDPLEPVQTDVPGIVIGVDPNAGELAFEQVQGSVCLTPTFRHADAVGQVHADADPEDAAIFRMAQLYRGQSFPGGSTNQCTELQDKLTKCPQGANRKNALNQCTFILRKPHFCNCASGDPSSGDLIELFKKCMGALCDNSGDLCRDFQADLKATNCAHRDGQATAFLTRQCKPGDLLVGPTSLKPHLP